MKVKLLLMCAKLCAHLGYDAHLPIPMGNQRCACVDMVDEENSITPFTLRYAPERAEPKAEYDDRPTFKYEDGYL